MKWYKSLLLIQLFLMLSCTQGGVEDSQIFEPEFTEIDSISYFFDNQISDRQVYVKGSVVKVLSDDNEGSRHQRLILEIFPDFTVLIAHNIDIAPRLDNIQEGDQITVFGEYEWNAKGGVIHWTHHDPQNNHEHGFILWNNREYQ